MTNQPEDLEMNLEEYGSPESNLPYFERKSRALRERQIENEHTSSIFSLCLVFLKGLENFLINFKWQIFTILKSDDTWLLITVKLVYVFKCLSEVISCTHSALHVTESHSGKPQQRTC